MLQQPNSTISRTEDEDFIHEQESGYRPGVKKSVSEYLSLDADDPSLQAWKASLLGQTITSTTTTTTTKKTTASSLNMESKVELLELALEVVDRPDVVLDLTSTNTSKKDLTFTIKEGVEYRIKVRFRVLSGILSGLKYLQVVKRAGIVMDKSKEMIGSYAANENPITVRFAPEEAPSGILSWGSYDVKTRFEDDDHVVHKELNWGFEIKKDW
ncbi:hypothetical protein BG004_002495 [Podila humilis]|nr:hypothetical protein BG004_002495 [Podila humilis]